MDSSQLNQDQELLQPDQKLSSEENYSSDYEMFSKKPERKFPYLWVVLGFIITSLIVFAILFFFLE